MTFPSSWKPTIHIYIIRKPRPEQDIFLPDQCLWTRSTNKKLFHFLMSECAELYPSFFPIPVLPDTSELIYFEFNDLVLRYCTIKKIVKNKVLHAHISTLQFICLYFVAWEVNTYARTTSILISTVYTKRVSSHVHEKFF